MSFLFSAGFFLKKTSSRCHLLLRRTEGVYVYVYLPLVLPSPCCSHCERMHVTCAPASWEKQQPCGFGCEEPATGLPGDGRRGNSLDRWVGSWAGERGHTCCLPGAHTHTHSQFAQKHYLLRQPPPSSVTLC